MAELTPVARLGRAFNFSTDDLRANREGKLTGRQRRALWRRFFVAVLISLVLLMIPILVGWGLVLWGTDQSLADALFDPATQVGLITGVLLAGFYAAVNYQALLLAVDVARGRVGTVSGQVERYGRYLYVKQRRFLLETRTLDLIQNGLQYTLYVLPGSQHILSVEFAE